MKDYQKSITVNNPADEVYSAIIETIQDWWSDDFSGVEKPFVNKLSGYT
ncbi:hypothetical protein [Mucilaginibacter sp.]|nr:hypothetical protein [Mucilaginibacter sp.]MDB5029510.1 hypothetical protein [Mucilaginibacter sp.]